MKYWIRPANINQFNLTKAYEEKEVIDWTQTNNYEVGDIVYLCSTAPIQKVTHKCLVEKINIPSNEIFDDKNYWLDNDAKNEADIKSQYVRLKLLSILTNNISLGDLNIESLRESRALTLAQVSILDNDSVSNEIEQSALDYLESDNRKYDLSVNEKQEKIRKYFVEERFPLEKVKKMGIDDYVEGKPGTYKDSFCYIIEFKLQQLGQIRGSFVKSKFVINYSEDRKQYEFQKGSKFGKTYQEVFNNVRNEIVKLIDACARDDYDAIESNQLSPMFKGKIYYIYYPEKTLPVYNPEHVNFFIRALGINCDLDRTGVFEKKRLMINWKNNSKIFSKFSNLEFINFLYSNYGFRKETDVLKNKDINYNEEPEYIQDKDLIDRAVKKSTESHRKPNFEEINRKRTAVGLSGEEYVLNLEKKHNPKFKKKIVRVGDDPSYGFDILSYDDQGNEKHIEVKTCNQGDINKVDFYITSHEKSKLEQDPCYAIYYVCGMRGKKRSILIFKKENLSNVTFEPIAYKITAKVKGQ